MTNVLLILTTLNLFPAAPRQRRTQSAKVPSRRIPYSDAMFEEPPFKRLRKFTDTFHPDSSSDSENEDVLRENAHSSNLMGLDKTPNFLGRMLRRPLDCVSEEYVMMPEKKRNRQHSSLEGATEDSTPIPQPPQSSPHPTEEPTEDPDFGTVKLFSWTCPDEFGLLPDMTSTQPMANEMLSAFNMNFKADIEFGRMVEYTLPKPYNLENLLNQLFFSLKNSHHHDQIPHLEDDHHHNLDVFAFIRTMKNQFDSQFKVQYVINYKRVLNLVIEKGRSDHFAYDESFLLSPFIDGVLISGTLTPEKIIDLYKTASVEEVLGAINMEVTLCAFRDAVRALQHDVIMSYKCDYEREYFVIFMQLLNNDELFPEFEAFGNIWKGFRKYIMDQVVCAL